MISTILHSKKGEGSGKRITYAVSFVFWIAVWQIVSVIVSSDVLLPSPVKVVTRFASLVSELTFWSAAGCSVLRILTGFFSALAIGVLLAVLSGAFSFARIITEPFMTVMKSVPVASFVILALLWLNPESLSAFIAFVMVLPIIYINTLSGINACDSKMLEMAKVFAVSPMKKMIYVVMPYVIPYFKSGCAVALGLCWKAGIAAELIGVPDGTIGEQLYFSKVYFEMADLFAWTIAIILISAAFEKLFMFVLNYAVRIYERK